MSIANLQLFAERLKKRRGEKRLTLREVAESVGVTVGAVAAWERGENFPKRIKELRLSQILDVDKEWLLGIAEKEKAQPDGHYEIDINKEDNDRLQSVCKMSRNPPDTVIQMAISYYTKLAKLKKSLPWEPGQEDIGPSRP